MCCKLTIFALKGGRRSLSVHSIVQNETKSHAVILQSKLVEFCIKFQVKAKQEMAPTPEVRNINFYTDLNEI